MPTATNIHNFITMYNKLCDDICLKTINFCDNMYCALLLFQKNIDHTQVYEQTIPNTFIDWDHVKILPSYAIYKDPNSWITLMHFIDCDINDLKYKALCSKNRIFAYFSECINFHVPDTKHEDTVKLFLLLNIVNLEALTVFELYFANISNKNMREQALLFFSKLANEQFDRQDRTATLVHLIKHILKVRVEDIVNEVEIMFQNRDSVREAMVQRHMRAIVKRPQLRSKQKNCDPVVDDTYKTWKDRIRFSNCFSVVNAKKLYFLMSQIHCDPNEHLDTHVKEEELRSTVAANIVKNPENATIVEVISNSRICETPFPELHAFREKGIASFSMVQRSKLRLNDLFHLYVAAYQPDWKSVWCAVVPIMSSQIIHDVDDFVRDYKFNSGKVMQILFQE